MPARPVAPARPEIAVSQGGIFTAEQARDEGFSARTIRTRLAAGTWVYVVGWALAEPQPRWTAFQLARAGLLTLPDAVVSHGTAGALHGFPLEPQQDQFCELIVPVEARRPGRGIRGHHVRLGEGDVIRSWNGLTMTSRGRTAIDLLGYLEWGPALNLWAWLSTRKVLDHEQLVATAGARKNWYGVVQLRRLVELTADGAVSEAEYRLQQLLTEAGITGWTANAPVRDARGLIGVVDLLFAKQKVVVEVDGFRAHSSLERFRSDRRRQNRLITAGYKVLRFTWDDLSNPQGVLREIRTALT